VLDALNARRVMPGVGLLALKFRQNARLAALSRRAAVHMSELKTHVSRRAAALQSILDIAKRALNNSRRGGWRGLNGSAHGQPNNGLHATGLSAAFIRKTWMLVSLSPGA